MESSGINISSNSLGTLKSVTLGEKLINKNVSEIPMVAWILLDEERSGLKMRSSYPEKRRMLTPIELVSKNIQLTGNMKIKVMRTQFPLLPAFAMTIHKSQGQSYDNVSIHAKPGMSRALLYVALSRARSLNGLSIHLDGNQSFESVLPKQKTMSTISVDEEICRLRTSLIRPIFASLRNDRPFLVYQNIQSYNCNGQRTLTDSIFRESEILVFVETWLTEEHEVDLASYSGMYRLDCTEKRGKGIMVAWKNSVDVIPLAKRRFFRNQTSIDLLSFKVHELFVIVVYKQCGMSENVMVDLLRRFIIETNVNPNLILGDFNSDLRNEISPLKAFLEDLNLKPLLDLNMPTTVAGTVIDGAFGYQSSLEGVLYENLISHHYPIVFKKFQ